jgi:hypothetical protein
MNPHRFVSLVAMFCSGVSLSLAAERQPATAAATNDNADYPRANLAQKFVRKN